MQSPAASPSLNLACSKTGPRVPGAQQGPEGKWEKKGLRVKKEKGCRRRSHKRETDHHSAGLPFPPLPRIIINQALQKVAHQRQAFLGTISLSRSSLHPPPPPQPHQPSPLNRPALFCLHARVHASIVGLTGRVECGRCYCCCCYCCCCWLLNLPSLPSTVRVAIGGPGSLAPRIDCPGIAST